jgi:hypothetical protein
MTEAAFYCVADDRFFLGAVGMVNSLRLQGHTEPIYLLDLGLSDEQRRLLDPEVSFVAAPPGSRPWLSKTIAPLRHPAETMVLIDADMVVTRPLGELLERAASGRIVAFRNDVERYFEEWGDLLDLGPVRRAPYICSGLVVCGGKTGAEVVRLLDDRQRRVEFERTYFGRDEPGYPFRFPEQDVLNAILASKVPPERFEALPRELAPMPPFAGVRVVDEARLRCVGPGGEEPFAVHHFGVKPWLAPTPDGVYSRLLRRLLAGADVAIRVQRRELPLRMRSNALGSLERRRIDLGHRLRLRARGAAA